MSASFPSDVFGIYKLSSIGRRTNVSLLGAVSLGLVSGAVLTFVCPVVLWALSLYPHDAEKTVPGAV